jgi:hypothetical protein
MTNRFEEAFIQCLKDGVYPGPANLNERYRADKKRFNRLNGEKTKQRLALMYEFGVPYQRGNKVYHYDNSHVIYNSVGSVPEWPYLYFNDKDEPPDPGYRKHEIQPEDQSWKLRRK